MKTPYSFSVLRYVHDVATGEFVNVGVVLYAPGARFLSAKFTSRYSHITKVFSNVDGHHLKRVVQSLEANLIRAGESVHTRSMFDKQESVENVAAGILPPDDSSLQFSPQGYGITENPQEALKQLFDRFVQKYYAKAEKCGRTDEEVWQTFRKPLKEKHIIQSLMPKQITGKNYEHNFKHCWKNEKWHIYEPISFDLVSKNEIVEKANVWLGRVTSLADGGGPFKLNILLGAPQSGTLKQEFIKAQNIMYKIPNKPSFIQENEAESLAEHLKKEMGN